MAHTKFPLAKDTLPINDYKFIISFCGGRRKENNIKGVYDYKVFCFFYFSKNVKPFFLKCFFRIGEWWQFPFQVRISGNHSWLVYSTQSQYSISESDKRKLYLCLVLNTKIRLSYRKYNSDLRTYSLVVSIDSCVLPSNPCWNQAQCVGIWW